MWRDPPVDYKHLYTQIVTIYPFSNVKGAIIEAVANSLDENASNIAIRFDPTSGTLEIEDWGKGFPSRDKFEKYHGFAFSFKKIGEGIGFAGLGSLLYLSISTEVITETRSDGLHLASVWKMFNGVPKWDYTNQRTLTHQGVKVTMRLKPRAVRALEQYGVEKIVQEFYNTLLYKGSPVILVNGKNVNPWEVDAERELTVRLGLGRGKNAVGKFILAKGDVDEEFQGIAVVTYGRTIERTFFKISTQLQSRITGWIIADHLIRSALPNKAGFHTDKSDWKNFVKAMKREFSKWIAEIEGVKEGVITPEKQRELDKLLREVRRILSEIPELSNIFGGSVTRKVGIQDPKGELRGAIQEGSQFVSGTLGGNGTGGQSVAVVGSDMSKSWSKGGGNIKGTVRRRRMRFGPKFYEDNYPNRLDDEVWLEGDVIVINSANPVYQKAKQLKNLWYHRLKCTVNVLIEYAGLEERAIEMQKKFFAAWGKG